MRILVINGPNLNMLGIREPHIYGSMRLSDIEAQVRALASSLGEIELEFVQSNHEGEIIDRIHAGHGSGLAGAIINPGAFTHYSIAILDAIKSVDYPFVEIHLSNLHKREPWRRQSVISEAVIGTVQGFGWRGYGLALRALVDHVSAS